MNIGDLPQGISILRGERLKAENKRLIGAKDMLASSLILRKVICGNPNWGLFLEVLWTFKATQIQCARGSIFSKVSQISA